jgi:4'-phosphopantetheinyl transferase
MKGRNTKGMMNTWRTPGSDPAVRENDVHVWLISVLAELAHLEDWAGILTLEEMARARSFVFEKDKNRYIVARGLLRRILGGYLGEKPEAVLFATRKRQKPVLAGAGSGGLAFNISHSKDYIIYAVARDREVGIDIEHLRPFENCDQIVNQFFSKNEIREYFALPDRLRQRAFFTCWTRKEAFLKAVGEGLYLPLDQFSVSPDPLVQAGIEIHSGYPVGRGWSLRDVALPNDQYVSALVVEGPEYELTCWEWRRC